jgi:hypothetical protein
VDNTPGPGAYEQGSSLAGPRFSMQGARNSARTAQVPGPGQYNPNEEFSKTMVPAYAIGKARRMNYKDESLPGPGSYEPHSAKEGPRWNFGTEKRLRVSLSEFPGPGSYESAGETGRPMYSMTARRPLTGDAEVPGPGTYTPKSPHASIFYSVGHASREVRNSSQVPGPASYNTANPKSRSAFFGTAKRAASVANEKNPGPGTYENLKKWEGPRFSLRSRKADKSAENVPVRNRQGPGNYNPVHSFRNEPAWKVGTEKREAGAKNKVPGPGSYEKKGELAGPKWGFAKSKRTQETKELSPGPAAYNIKASIPDVPAYSGAG